MVIFRKIPKKFKFSSKSFDLSDPHHSRCRHFFPPFFPPFVPFYPMLSPPKPRSNTSIAKICKCNCVSRFHAFFPSFFILFPCLRLVSRCRYSAESCLAYPFSPLIMASFYRHQHLTDHSPMIDRHDLGNLMMINQQKKMF